MTATYNPAEVERLVREAREQYALTEQIGYGVSAGTMSAMADQLEAARAEVARLTECMRVAGLQCFMRGGSPERVAQHMRSVAASWTEHEAKAADAQRLRARIAELEASVERMAPVVAAADAWRSPDAGGDEHDRLVDAVDAVDAYRAKIHGTG